MRKGKSTLRAIVAVLGLIGVTPALAGCEGAEASLPPTKHATMHSATGFPPPRFAFARFAQPEVDTGTASMPLDLPAIGAGARAVARSAERTAAELPALRRTIALCTLALLGVGLLNAALLGAVLAALRAMQRASATIGAASAAAPPVAPQAAVPPVATVAAAGGGRMCGCGDPLSSRSRSGRCRRCANRRRSARAAT